MAGLDNLVHQITKEAEIEAENILSEARAEADNIKAIGEAKTKKEIERMNEKSARELDLMKDRLKSNAQLKARNLKLAVKQEAIQNTFKGVIEELKNMSAEDYVAYIKKNMTNEAAQLVVVKEQVAIVEEIFPKCRVLKDRFVTSGFIEVTDTIENNFTFESKLSLVKEEVEGQLAKILYGNE